MVELLRKLNLRAKASYLSEQVCCSCASPELLLVIALRPHSTMQMRVQGYRHKLKLQRSVRQVFMAAFTTGFDILQTSRTSRYRVFHPTARTRLMLLATGVFILSESAAWRGVVSIPEEGLRKL